MEIYENKKNCVDIDNNRRVEVSEVTHLREINKGRDQWWEEIEYNNISVLYVISFQISDVLNIIFILKQMNKLPKSIVRARKQ